MPRTTSLLLHALLPLVAALVLAVGASGQEVFRDSDFEFDARLPAGMRLATPEEASRLMGLAAPEFLNKPRSDAGAEPLAHRWIWIDATTPYARQVVVELRDGKPPIRKPTDLSEALKKAGGQLIGEAQVLAPPVSGLRADANFPGASPYRRAVVILPDPHGNRFATAAFQANQGDWDIVAKEFDATIDSLRMPRTLPPQAGQAPAGPAEPGQTPLGAPPKAGAQPRPAAAAQPAEAPADWGSLPVLGSLLLAALILGSLVLSGKAP
ncbi:MAG: hypothetical protein ACT4PU_12865 [Planctomycetota bacterium]